MNDDELLPNHRSVRFRFTLPHQIIVLSTAALTDEKVSRIGYGVQHLKSVFKSKVLHAGSTTLCDNVESLYFTDAIKDNFAPADKIEKWENPQRYWINKELWAGPGAPIFVFIGGEGAEGCSRLTNRMYTYNLAKEHNGLLIDVEHRFYGESLPTSDMSTANLHLLSAEQALADLARIITFIKKDLNTEVSQVITIGGSYPGNLAAYFRLKYPSVSQGSIASSAPVKAQINFSEYMDVVGQSIIYFSGQKCFDAMEAAANTIATLASGGAGSPGMQQLEKDFATCSSIVHEFDLAVLYSDLMGNIQGTVQYNNEHSGVMNVTDVCKTMLSTDDAYTQFVALMAEFRQVNGQECEDANFADTIAYLSNPAKDSTNAARPWTYQTCNEFGYYQTTDSKNQPFHAWKELNLDFSRAICAKSFNGWSTDPRVGWTNTLYGDVHIAGTNIIFTSGSIDPWHALGVTNSTAQHLPNKSELPVYITGTAHCNDLYAPANSDPASLTNARQIVSETVSKWLTGR